LKIVHTSNFENCSYFEFVFNFKIIHISIFCSKLKIVHISNFIQTKKKEKGKTYTLNIMGRGPTRHPMRAGYAAPGSSAANGRRIGAPSNTGSDRFKKFVGPDGTRPAGSKTDRSASTVLPT
jgi:hypothetical protein